MSKRPDLHRLMELHTLLLRFQAMERMVHIPGTHRAENNTEHSYNLAMAAWFLAQYFPNLDRDKVIRLALVHDLVEVHAGDTFFIGPGRKTKDAREAAALKQFEEDWPDFEDMLETIRQYEARDTNEAKFVYALDKILPIILVYQSEGYSWHFHKLSLADLHNGKQAKIKVSPEIVPYYEQLYELLVQKPEYFHGKKPHAAPSKQG